MPLPTWDNTTLFVDDDPDDRAFRQEVREWIGENLPADLCNRSTRIDPPELKPWHPSSMSVAGSHPIGRRSTAAWAPL